MVGMLGFTPDEVRNMSLAEAALAMDGFGEKVRAEAGVPNVVEPPSIEEVNELMLLYPD